MAIDTKPYLAQLNARRRELSDLLGDSAESRQPVELDQSKVGRLSRIDALQNQAMAEETARRRRDEIARIDAALKRLEAGDFGYCVRCGEEIGEKRLALDPAIALCIDCASRS